MSTDDPMVTMAMLYADLKVHLEHGKLKIKRLEEAVKQLEFDLAEKTRAYEQQRQFTKGKTEEISKLEDWKTLVVNFLEEHNISGVFDEWANQSEGHLMVPMLKELCKKLGYRFPAKAEKRKAR